jgi:hypothetical protein
MGLDTTHDCWHGAYGAFNRWRDHVAEAAGYAVVDRGVQIDWDDYVSANYAGEWNRIPADPLIFLIVHSDCDGVIHPAQAGPLADRLEELLPKVNESDARGHISRLGMRGTTERFITGLRAAVEANEDVDFR